MIALLQRVSSAAVSIEGAEVAAIGRGALALIGVETLDGQPEAERLLERILAWRMFADADGRMNLNLQQAGGGLLLVPQFTLAADTSKGHRAGFSTAAPPDQARELFSWLLKQAELAHRPVAAGRFGADMQVALVNDGPVTFNLRVPPGAGVGETGYHPRP